MAGSAQAEIVAASLAPGASVSVVARQYDVNTNLVFSWRKRYGRRAERPACRSGLCLSW
ncbi:MAG: transposase [Rhodospirillales bacterium]